MTEAETIIRLAEADHGASLFVSYLAGRAPTDKAIREAQRSNDSGFAKRHYVGKLANKWYTKNGEFVFCVRCLNRDDERNGLKEGYRTFNPSLGSLLTVEVIEDS